MDEANEDQKDPSVFFRRGLRVGVGVRVCLCCVYMKELG